MSQAMLTPEMIAELLSVKPATVRTWVRNGQLKACRAGRLIRVRPQDLDDFLDTHERSAGTDHPGLSQAVERLASAYNPERIYLFGSRARGEAGADSDFDLLLIVPDDAPAEKRRSKLAYEVLWETGISADVLVWTRGYFDSRLDARSSLASTVMREGKVLYAA